MVKDVVITDGSKAPLTPEDATAGVPLSRFPLFVKHCADKPTATSIILDPGRSVEDAFIDHMAPCVCMHEPDCCLPVGAHSISLRDKQRSSGCFIHLPLTSSPRLPCPCLRASCTLPRADQKAAHALPCSCRLAPHLQLQQSHLHLLDIRGSQQPCVPRARAGWEGCVHLSAGAASARKGSFDHSVQ